jgi:hypothetical protein
MLRTFRAPLLCLRNGLPFAILVSARAQRRNINCFRKWPTPDQAVDKPDSPLASAESPARIAHLNMLQAGITRLAGNVLSVRPGVSRSSARCSVSPARPRVGGLPSLQSSRSSSSGLSMPPISPTRGLTVTCTTGSSRRSGTIATV